MENKNQTFSYTYSAEKQEEIKKIRQKYIPEECDKMEQLRRLDKSVTQKGSVTALVLGVIGALIMGFGMSLAMSELGKVFGNAAMPLGIACGIAGIALISLAYPIYKRITKRERERLAPEILRLTDELLK